LDNDTTDRERELMAQEFYGKAIKAMRDPHANHVLQRCIETMPPVALQFMFDELVNSEGGVKRVATHRYGHRIIQQLLRKCRAPQTNGLVEDLLQHGVALACHNYGAYAVQHVLLFGTMDQQYRMLRIIEQNVESICETPAGHGVIAAALEYAPSDDRVWAARAVLKSKQGRELLFQLAGSRHGHGAVLRIISVLQGSERMQAVQALEAGMADLQASRFGRKVAARLEALCGTDADGSHAADCCM